MKHPSYGKSGLQPRLGVEMTPYWIIPAICASKRLQLPLTCGPFKVANITGPASSEMQASHFLSESPAPKMVARNFSIAAFPHTWVWGGVIRVVRRISSVRYSLAPLG